MSAIAKQLESASYYNMKMNENLLKDDYEQDTKNDKKN